MIGSNGFANQDGGPYPEAELLVAQTTGRQVVVFADDEADPAAVLRRVAGMDSVASTAEYGPEGLDVAEAESADVAYFAELGVAVVKADPEQVRALQAAPEAHEQVLAVVPEYVHHALPAPADYLAGYRDGVAQLAAQINGTSSGHAATATAVGAPPAAVPAATFADTDAATWGLQATRVVGSSYSGKGIRVAVLDTGMDLAHPDFAGRNITARSFVAGAEAQDGNGHGTHCIGTSCGPKNPEGTRRYGIAHQAQIYVGKVLSDRGSGTDTSILAGINWAITNDVHIVSMSLGAPVPQTHPPYNHVGARALRRGTLIIAAAGNNADRRQGNYGFVGIPANSPAIVAVGALDQVLGTTWFSARTLPLRGGQVDIAGPGLDVYSSWPMPTRYNTISGTSMATPHVSGVAALLAEATDQRGISLWGTLVRESTRLAEPALDVGSGLVVARG